jgi:hypothetical protein
MRDSCSYMVLVAQSRSRLRSGVSKVGGIDWVWCFEMILAATNQSACLQTSPLEMRTSVAFSSTTRCGSSTNGQLEAMMLTNGPVPPSVSVRGRRVSCAQGLESDTLQVPETHGVQCCLVHNRPCRPSRVSWCDCNPLPFLSPCYDLCSLNLFHWQRCCDLV